MNRNLQKMLHHARSTLEASLQTPSNERIRLYQKFLKIENRRLLSMHRAGTGGMEVARGRSAMMDTLLHYIFLGTVQSQTPLNKKIDAPPQICLVATGGYGRGELNPFSDIDILFLLSSTGRSDSARINNVIEQSLYLLWDLGLKIGYATRTIQECVEQAKKDMQSRTALFEARFLDGIKPVFTDFQKTMERHCLHGHARAYITERLKDQAQRHAKYGNTVFVQEPNVKNGCGGLRDLQNLFWIVRFKNGVTTLEELQQQGFLTQMESGRLARAYDFLMRVRNELHYANERAVDEITLSAQPKIAEAIGYTQKDVLQRIEIFMRDYYRHARDIYVLTEALTKKLSLEEKSSSNPHRWSKILTSNQKGESLNGGLFIKNGVIECGVEPSFPKDPYDLLQIFRIAQLRKVHMGAGLQSLIRSNLKMVNSEFLYSKRAREIFFPILRSKGEVGCILRMMHECGFLGKYIPEFGKLDCLVQHEFYHRYTADEHTLVAIEKLDAVFNTAETSAAPYARIFQQLKNAYLLYLAILLHDTGKASRTYQHADASTECAQQVARRFCMTNETRSTLLWLVDHHISMSKMVQRRDIEDPSSIQDFVEIVGTRERLDMLHLLTFVDGQAVGSTGWNEWRQLLLWQLYERTLKAINTRDVEKVQTGTLIELLRKAVTPRLISLITEDEIEAHFIHMPERYWQRVEEDELIWHFEALHAFFEKLLNAEIEGSAPVVRWRHFPDRGYSEAVVCSWDRHGLFAKIAGSFAAARIHILNADIYTRADDLVLDIFQVCDLEHHAIQDESKIKKMVQILTESLTEINDFSFTEAIHQEYESMRYLPHQGDERFPTTIVFNNEDSADYTILEIQTPDRLGLLYYILQVLTECELDIELAKINTEMGAAMDVFYLIDTHGSKILEPSRLEFVQKKLLETIDKINQPYRS